MLRHIDTKELFNGNSELWKAQRLKAPRDFLDSCYSSVHDTYAHVPENVNEDIPHKIKYFCKENPYGESI